MDPEKLQILIQIVDAGSIQGAARQMSVTRASLRRSLDAMEEEIGTPLLHRDSSGVRLTAAGSVLVDRGRLVLEDYRALLADARAAAGEEAAGMIRVLEPVGAPLAVRVQGLLAIRQANPQLRITIRQFEDPLAHLQEDFELMLHEGTAPERNAWFSRVVLRAPLRLAASRGYLEKRGKPKEVAALAEHEILGWKRPRVRADEWPLLAGGSVSVSPWLTSPDPLLLLTLAAAGGGIVLAPQTPLFQEPGSEPLVTLLEDQVGAEFVIRVSSPLTIKADSRTRNVLAKILERLESLPQD